MNVKSPHAPDDIGRTRLHVMLDAILGTRKYTGHEHLVRRLEAQICARLGVKHCVCVSSGTMGLMVALRACGANYGFVYVPSWTFPATVQAVTWMGMTAVYLDYIGIGQADFVTLHGVPSAQIAVRLWGIANCAYARDISNEPLKPMIIDSAHAFGTRFADGTYVGGAGSCEVFSFHANEIISTFEGGCITTNDDKVAEAARSMITFGIGDRHIEHIDDLVVNEPVFGTNGKMSEIHAAMGLVMMERLDDIIEKNRASYEMYRESLAGLPVKLLEHPKGSNCQYIVIETEKRNEIAVNLQERGKHSKRYCFPSCHRLPLANAIRQGEFPETERLARVTLVLPHAKTAEQAVMVARIIGETLQ